jgi:hypothetical protein
MAYSIGFRFAILDYIVFEISSMLHVVFIVFYCEKRVLCVFSHVFAYYTS